MGAPRVTEQTEKIVSEMWNKRLLRTIPPSSEEPGGGGKVGLSALCLILVSVLVILSGNVAEARSYPMEEHFLTDSSATTMIQFRGALKRIIHGSLGSSLTFVVPEEKEKVTAAAVSHVQGLRFHVVQNPLLCDEDLSQDSIRLARFVSEEEDVLDDVAMATHPLVNYVCAVWPVEKELSAEGNNNQRLEWLSANGIEQRSTEGDQQLLMVMHLEKPIKR